MAYVTLKKREKFNELYEKKYGIKEKNVLKTEKEKVVKRQWGSMLKEMVKK